MSKMKVQDATKELSRRAAKLLGDVTGVRTAAEKTLAELRKIENGFTQQQEAEREEKRREEQQKALSSQSKAWTMPDDVPVEKTEEKKEEPKPAAKQPEAKPAAPAARPQQNGNAPRAQGGSFAPRGDRPQGAPRAQGGNFAPRGDRPQGGNFAPRGDRPQGGGFAPRGDRPQGGNFAPRGDRPQGGFGARNGQQGGARPAGGMGGQRPMGGRPQRAPKGPELMPTVEKERVSNYDPNKKMRQRQHDPEYQPVKNRKQLARDTGYGMDDDVVRGRRKKGRQLSAQQMMAPIKIETAYMTAETITVRDLTERIGKPAGEIIKKLMLLGIMATINQELDFDTASLVASEFGVTLEMKLDKTAEDALSAENVEDSEEELVTRPPVVTIMGHVDHGKTSLLDYIRKAKVAAGEAGGITQHIGAYIAKVGDRQITFLDTPGHEAFTAMRARGTQATDIAILVVAADDGVMPQTIESINHAKAAKCPIIVAINKIDKPGADPDAVKQELTRYELVPEEWGGDTIMVNVSAKTGEGIDDLLENVLLLADMLELKANPNRKARGVIIEAKLDHSRGAVATALVQNGTLHVGDMVVAGNAYGRIRAMVSSRGERVKHATPSTPVEIIGFGGVPEAGDEFMAVADEKLARQVVEERAAKARASMVKNSSASTLEDLYSKLEQGEVKDLNIIIKADVQGSVEAVKQSLEKLSNAEVRVRTIHSGVRRDYRERRHARRHRRCDHHRLQRPSGCEGARGRKPRRHRYPLLPRDLSGDRGYGEGHEGSALSGIPRERHRPRGSAQRVQNHGRGHRRRFVCHRRQAPAQRSGSPAARQRGGLRGQALFAPALQRRGQGSGRRLRVRCVPGKLHGYQGRRRHRVLRDGRNSEVIDFQGQQARPGCMLCRRAVFFK